MFFYLYDAVVLDKKYAALLDRVESRVIELGINGRVERLTPLRNLKELIEHGIKNGAHTVVIVGSDQTFLHAMQVVAQQDVTLGFLPLGESLLGKLFGVTDPLEGCNSLSRRITKPLTLGKANKTFFLTAVTATVPRGTQLKCNQQWTIITQTEQTAVTISHAGKLKLALQPQASPKGFLRKITPLHPTQVELTELKVEHPDLAVALLLDGQTTLKAPVSFSLKPKALKVIVGKDRLV